MSAKNIKKILFTLTISSVLLVIGNSSLPAEAKYNPVSRKTCSLAVAPYNPSSPAITGLAADQYINFLSNDTCNQFVKLYGNAYFPQPPNLADNPVKAGAENMNVPIIRHDHAYYNDTEQDANFYYKSFVDKFEITVQPDGFNSIDLNKIECQTPYPVNYDTSKLKQLQNCSGTLDDLWGGTTVTKQTADNKLVITWDFGTTNQNGKFTGRPQIWANNGPNFDQAPGLNLTDENNRKLAFNIHLPSKDNDNIWSTTTTSKVLVADLAINKANYSAHKNDGCVNNDVNDSNSGWCYIDPKDNEPTKNYPTENVFTTANHSFYWFDIGSVATVWKKANPNICTELKATLDDKNPIQINNTDAYPMTVNGITFSPQNTIPKGAELKWTTDDPNGTFWTDVTIYPDDPSLPGVTTQAQIGKGWVNTSATSTKKVYYMGKPESKITVTIDKIPADQIGPQCNAAMTTPAIPECSELLIDHPETVYENTYSTFNAKALGTDNKDLKGKIKYWVDPGYGEFYVGTPPKDVPANKSKMIYGATPTNQAFPFIDSKIQPGYNFDPKILIAGNNTSQAANSFINIAPKIATGKFGIQDLSSNINDPAKLGLAVQIKVIELPKWVTNPLPSNPVDSFNNPASDQTYDSNPGKYGLNDVFNIDPTQPINIKNIDIQSTSAIDNQFSAKNYFFISLFESVKVDPNTPVYFYAKKPGKGVIHVQVIGSSNPDCSNTFDIAGQCKALNLTSDPISPLTVGQSATLKVNPIDSTGKALPATTNIQFTTTAGGTFNTSLSSVIAAKVSEFPITFKDSKNAGQVSVTVDPNDPAYTQACSGSVEVVAPVIGQCTKINPTIYDVAAKNNVSKLEKGKQYLVNANIKTTTNDAHKLTYTIDPQYGYFTDMTDLFNPKKVTQITLDEIKASPLILTTLDTPPNTPTGSIASILKIQAAGFTDISKCNTSFPFFNPEQLCKSITISPSDFDPTATNPTTFTIGGDFKNHNGSIQVSISSASSGTKPTIKRTDIPTQETNGNDSNPPVTFTSDEVKNSNNQLQFIYTKNSFGDYTPPATNTLDISVKAVGAENICHAEIHKTSSPTQPCNPAVQNCGGGGGGTATTSPTFQKFAYSENHIKNAATTININKNTNYVTYMLVLKTGNNIKDSSIIDKKLQNGQIRAINNKVPGFLQFSDMKIELIKGNSQKTLFATDNYKNNESSAGKFSQFSDQNFTGIQNDQYPNNLCTTDKTKDKTKGLPCIDANSLDAIPAMFSSNGTISFKQLNNLSNNDYIIVKYQMNYPIAYRISDEKCQQLSKEGGCGQEFDNLAHFDATYKSSSSIYKSDASTKVIAICPYVLSRQGGDVFFHDLIQTGVDVNQCSEVKNCEGPCIKPEPPEEKKINKTGAGDSGPQLLLKSPSHDVCNASNSSTNLEGYNDVLKNFSSSICELQVDISKAWTKQNITDSINANVKRISRFDNNLNDGSSSISNVAQLRNKTNAQSGVFIKTDGDLTITGNGTSGYEISSLIDGTTTIIPAAQTYIVKGHDLHIKSNVQYNSLGLNTFYNNKTIPSAAFIVIDGNIIIDSNVSHIDGILMAVDTTNSDKGQIMANGFTDILSLNINGSMIGNVYDLFRNRQYAGDPLKDDGSVNIHYDERVLLNPPPGISELINLQQVVVPN